MATNTEKIEQLIPKVIKLETLLEEKADRLGHEISLLREDFRRVQQLCDTHVQKLAALEERCKSLETGATRNWQVWLALLAAGIALLVSFLKK